MLHIPGFLASLPKEWIVFLLSIIPLFEVRASVPIGIYLGLNPINTVIIGVLGSILPIIPIFYFLYVCIKYLRHIKIFRKFILWLFKRTRAKSKIIEQLELVGLTLFIAIPLPGSGVWSGTVAAFIFRIKWWKTILCAVIGTTLASLIMLFLSLKVSGSI